MRSAKRKSKEPLKEVPKEEPKKKPKIKINKEFLFRTLIAIIAFGFGFIGGIGFMSL